MKLCLFILFIFSAKNIFAATNQGALIRVQMNSTVGVFLDDIPQSFQTRAIATYLDKPELFWKARAIMQVEATLYQLIYRNSFYGQQKGRLPLPPKQQWKITVSKPSFMVIDSHQLVAVNYVFESVLLTSAASAIKAEPALGTVGGQWREPFVLPADPDLLFERTGYSCMDEADFPPNSVDSENARNFYDQTCLGGRNLCHVTAPFPKDSCNEALKNNVGRINTTILFQRIPWNNSTANDYRSGDASPAAANLEVVGKGLETNRIIYRYISINSCALAEGCVGAPGWRRLLQFDASIANKGRSAIHLGEISSESTLVKKNMFEFSACHGHYHFSHYGKFMLNNKTQALSSKRAFCLASTSRYSNNEASPLTHDYTCENQGIEAGWGDDYIAGIECQWLDITDIKKSQTAILGFQVNPDKFLCEGDPILDFEKNFTFIPTEFKTETGAIQNRIACDFSPSWDQNNFSGRKVVISKQGSFVTTPCSRGQISSLRNCGFSEHLKVQNCKPNSKVLLKCSQPNSTATLIRICEASAVLGVGVGCTYKESLANSIIENQSTSEIEFTCPPFRDLNEVGGKYSIYTTSLFDNDPFSRVTCAAMN